MPDATGCGQEVTPGHPQHAERREGGKKNDEIPEDSTMSDTLTQLADLIALRRQASPDTSYVAKLQHAGLNKILEKVGEEAVETLLAARDVEQGASRDKLIYETADLWFHTLVMLGQLDCRPEEVLAELERRFGMSGLTEKAARG